MELSQTERRQLRNLGWSVLPREAKRPPALPAKDVLHVEDQVVIDEQKHSLIELDDIR